MVQGDKKKLTPAKDILNRLKWESKIPNDSIIIGYEDRFKGILKISIDSFENSDIPMHRIREFHLGDQKIWDRTQRLDRLTGCNLDELIENSNVILEDNDENDDEEHENHNNNSNNNNYYYSNLPPVTLSKKKKRKHIQPYIPSDYLETWMLQNHDSSLALNFPTHISQKGAYYHIAENLEPELLSHWYSAITREEKFYMEEVRGDLSPLYFDIDLKSMEREPVEIISSEKNSAHNWMPCIINTVRKFTGLNGDISDKNNNNTEHQQNNKKMESFLHTVVVTASHGSWNDSLSTANWKSGYRIYFPRLWVDQTNLRAITQYLGQELAQVIQSYPGQPKDWKWDDIVDIGSCNHERARMLGSVKWRRGKVLGRIYHFCGAISSNGSIDYQLTNELKQDPIQMLKLTSVRLGIDDVPRLILLENQKKLINKYINLILKQKTQNRNKKLKILNKIFY